MGTNKPDVVRGDELRVDLAGVPVSLESQDSDWLALARRWFVPFTTSSPVRLRITQTTCRPRPHLRFDRSGRAERLQLATLPGGFSIDGETFSASVDLVAGEVEIAGPCALYPLDSVLRHTLPLLLDNGVLLHAGAAAEGTEGVVFSGPSGAGKSTMATMLGGRALCDEMAAVFMTREGPVLRSTPFWSCRPGSARLASIHLLAHGHSNRMRRVQAEDALRELLSLTLWPLHDEAASARCLMTLGSVVDNVPVWKFEFVPGPGLWQIMVGQAEIS